MSWIQEVNKDLKLTLQASSQNIIQITFIFSAGVTTLFALLMIVTNNNQNLLFSLAFVGLASALVALLVFSYLINIQHRQLKEMEVEQKRLMLEKEVAEATARARSEFLSTMSHEIRTPMNAVIGMSHILLQDNPREEQIPNLKILKFSAENLLSLINDILDYNKLESGKLNFEETNFNLNDTINSITHSLKSKIKENDNQMVINIGEDVPQNVIGDPTRLAQVLNNLLSNAAKFTQDGTITLDINLNKEKEGKYVLLDFAITDTVFLSHLHKLALLLPVNLAVLDLAWQSSKKFSNTKAAKSI